MTLVLVFFMMSDQFLWGGDSRVKPSERYFGCNLWTMYFLNSLIKVVNEQQLVKNMLFTDTYSFEYGRSLESCTAVTGHYSRQALMHTTFLFKQTCGQKETKYIASSSLEGKTHNFWISNTSTHTCSLAHTSVCGGRDGRMLIPSNSQTHISL